MPRPVRRFLLCLAVLVPMLLPAGPAAAADSYTATCRTKERFRTIMGTPAGSNDLLTAYPVD